VFINLINFCKTSIFFNLGAQIYNEDSMVATVRVKVKVRVEVTLKYACIKIV